MNRTSCSSSRCCWVLGLSLVVLPTPALATPFARFAQELTSTSPTPGRPAPASPTELPPAISPPSAPAPDPGEDVDPAAAPPSGTPPAAPAAATSPAAAAGAAAPTLTPDEEDAVTPWVVGGFVDTQYVVNSNFPDNHIFRGTPNTPRTGEFSPNLVVGYVRRDPIKSPWMLELALQAGPAADALYAAEPVAGGPAGRYAGVEVFKHIGRANAGVKLKGGTELAAGLMLAPTHFGSFWARDNWHSSITWGYSSVPFYLMGARVYQPLGDKAGIGLWLANSYGLMGDANKAPVGLLNLVIMPVKGLTLVENVYAGPEDTSLKPEAWRLLLDSQIVYVADKWGIAAVGDYGREKLTFRTDRPVAQWANAMVSVRGEVMERKHFKWFMAGRPECFWDRNGRIYGAPDRDNWLYGATYTNDFRLFEGLLFRVEYRYDRSTASKGFWYRGDQITDDAARLAHDQHSIIFNFIGYFERRLPRMRN